MYHQNQSIKLSIRAFRFSEREKVALNQIEFGKKRRKERHKARVERKARKCAIERENEH